MSNKDKKRKHRYYRQQALNNKKAKLSAATTTAALSENDSSEIKNQKLVTLHDHLKGFLITCNQKEYQCLQESYNLLNEIFDKLYLINEDDCSTDQTKTIDPNDIEACIQQEISQQKSKRKRFFQIKTKCKNLLFININQDNDNDIRIDPNEIILTLFEQLKQTRKQNCRHIQRIIPVLETCKAEKILECFERIFLEKASKNVCKFAVHCKIRNNSSFQEKSLLEQVVTIVRDKRPNWIVNLDNPDQLIMIQIVCKSACISLLTDYNKYAKYNLIEFVKRLNMVTNPSSSSTDQISEDNSLKITTTQSNDTTKDTLEESEEDQQPKTNSEVAVVSDT